MSVHLVNPSDNSFGTAVITPRWLFVLASATPATVGEPILVDESLEQIVPESIQPGDIVVAHSFLAHGTSANTTDVRRDMIFQRRVAVPLVDPVTQADARLAFMRDPWAFFRRPSPSSRA